jgi:hypothetical protein
MAEILVLLRNLGRKVSFSLKRLFVSSILISIGIACVAASLRYERSLDDGSLILLWVCGGTVLGAGVLCPFRLTIFGAVIGFLIQAAIVAAIIHGLSALNGL